MTCTNTKTAEADQARMSLFGVGKHQTSVRQTFVENSLGVSQHLVFKGWSPFDGCLYAASKIYRVTPARKSIC